MILGGIVPDEDVDQLKEMGVAAIFGPGTSTQDIIQIVFELSGAEAV